MIEVTVNGSSHLTASRTVAELAAEFAGSASLLLIEYNGTALTRDEWAGTVLAAGDRIEVLRISAGG